MFSPVMASNSQFLYLIVHSKGAKRKSVVCTLSLPNYNCSWIWRKRYCYYSVYTVESRAWYSSFEGVSSNTVVRNSTMLALVCLSIISEPVAPGSWDCRNELWKEHFVLNNCCWEFGYQVKHSLFLVTRHVFESRSRWSKTFVSRRVCKIIIWI